MHLLAAPPGCVPAASCAPSDGCSAGPRAPHSARPQTTPRRLPSPRWRSPAVRVCVRGSCRRSAPRAPRPAPCAPARRCWAISRAARCATASASSSVVRRVILAAARLPQRRFRGDARRVSRKHRFRRPQRRRVRGVAQQRLADALAEDAGLAARGAEDRPLVLAAAALGAPRAQSARRAVEAQAAGPEAVSQRRGPAGPAPAARGRAPSAPRRPGGGRWPCPQAPRRARSDGSAASPGARPASPPAAPPPPCSRGGGAPSAARASAARRRISGGSKAPAMRSRHGIERSHARSTT